MSSKAFSRISIIVYVAKCSLYEKCVKKGIPVIDVGSINISIYIQTYFILSRIMCISHQLLTQALIVASSSFDCPDGQTRSCNFSTCLTLMLHGTQCHLRTTLIVLSSGLTQCMVYTISDRQHGRILKKANN